jgi:hypothetical protein
MVDIIDLAHINGDHSRTVGDEVIKLFTSYIKEVFGKTNAEYIYNGNGSFVMLVEKSDYITVEDMMALFRLRLDERDELRELVLEYKIGIAEVLGENKTARKLLSETIKSKKTYRSSVTP